MVIEESWHLLQCEEMEVYRQVTLHPCIKGLFATPLTLLPKGVDSA